MRRLQTARVLCVDTEWTCWDGPPPDGMRPEIVEIGIVEADVDEGCEIRRARYLVRPRRSEVSSFCTSLTGLTPREVAGGHPLPEVLRTLAKAFGPGGKVTFGWGDDLAGIERECTDLGEPCPFPRQAFRDLSVDYALLTGDGSRPGVTRALETFGLAFEGRPHRAVDDAWNTLRIHLAMAVALRSTLACDPVPVPGR